MTILVTRSNGLPGRCFTPAVLRSQSRGRCQLLSLDGVADPFPPAGLVAETLQVVGSTRTSERKAAAAGGTSAGGERSGGFGLGVVVPDPGALAGLIGDLLVAGADVTGGGVIPRAVDTGAAEATASPASSA